MLTVAGVIASTGTAVVGARNLLNIQAERARSVIPKSWDTPPRADGVYAPGGGPVRRWDRNTPFDLHLMVFGDSTATGYGCRDADEVPGVLIARGLAEEPGKLTASLGQAYRSQQFRLRLSGADQPIYLRELVVRVRPTQGATSLQETLADGRYRYVTTINP